MCVSHLGTYSFDIALCVTEELIANLKDYIFKKVVRHSKSHQSIDPSFQEHTAVFVQVGPEILWCPYLSLLPPLVATWWSAGLVLKSDARPGSELGLFHLQGLWPYISFILFIFFNLSELHFLICKRGIIIAPVFVGSEGWNGTLHTKHLESGIRHAVSA